MSGPEARSSLPFDFLATVADKQPQLLEELPPRDAYILLAHSDIKNTRTLAEMAPIFGISTNTIGRIHRRALRQVVEGANTAIKAMFPLEEIEAGIKTNDMVTVIESTRRTFEDPKKRPKILARMSRGHKRSYRNNPELRGKISLASTGTHHTEESRAKIRAKLKGRKRPLEVFASTIGIPRTPEVRAKISATIRKKLQDPKERKRKASFGFAGKRHAAKTIKRMRESAIKVSVGKDKSRESNVDIKLWKYAIANHLLPMLIESGYLTADELNALKEHFEKGRKMDNPYRLLNQFSLGVANLS